MNKEALKFVEECEKKNSELALIEEKEVVSDDLAFEAEVIAKNMKVDGVGDALLFAAALNVLNTYVKQSKECKEVIGYSFKKCVDILLRYVSRNPNEMIKAEVQRDKDMSLCIIEINSIQFSYHNIELNEDNRKLMAKDLDNPTMAWDGIRKQMCSVTLFNFAKDNEFGRANKMIDGTDFNEGLNKLLDDFHSGKLTLADSKKTFYGKNVTIKTKTFDETKDYPFRNRNIAVLYRSSVALFKEELNNRTIFDKLFKSYEEGYGFVLSNVTRYEWKYAIESISRLFLDERVNADATICFLYTRAMNKEFPVFVTASRTDGSDNVALIQLLPWSEMCVNDMGLVEYVNSNGNQVITASHPSNMMRPFAFSIMNALSVSGNTKAFPCTYFYNACFSETSNIVSDVNKEIIDASPIFYASERDELCEYCIKSLEGTNGDEIIDSISNFGQKYMHLGENDYSVESSIIVQFIVDEKLAGKKLYVIDERHASGDTKFVKLLDDSLKASKAKYKLFDSKIPESTKELSAEKNIVVCDFDGLTEDKYREIKELETEFALEGNIVEERKLMLAMGFNDLGGGVNFITNAFRMAADRHSLFQPSLYKLKLFYHLEDLTEEDGCVCVTVPDDVKYNQIDDTLEMSDARRVDLYHKFISGVKGIKLYVEDVPLRNLINDKIEDVIERNMIITGSSFEETKTFADFGKANRMLLQNTDEYNKYASEVIKSIGGSAFAKLAEDCKSWVVTAMSEYYSIKNTDPTMDFSGAVLLISKTFETELNERVAIKYMDWIKKTYPNDYIDHLPESLYEYKYNEKKEINTDKITLGGMPFVMGVNAKGVIQKQEDYDLFCKYAKEEAFAEDIDIDKAIKELIEIIYYVRVNFRNASAHKGAIDIAVANDCVQYCITEKRKLGVVMDTFRK